MSLEIELSVPDVVYCRERADKRWRKAQKLGPGKGETVRHAPRELLRHVVGVFGECMAQRFYGHRWHDDTDFGRHGDFDWYDVRGTTHRTGHLPVFPPDPATRLLLLVVIDTSLEAPTQRGHLVGFYTAGLAKRPYYDPPEGKLRPGSQKQWWVPQAHLDRPIPPRITVHGPRVDRDPKDRELPHEAR